MIQKSWQLDELKIIGEAGLNLYIISPFTEEEVKQIMDNSLGIFLGHLFNVKTWNMFMSIKEVDFSRA